MGSVIKTGTLRSDPEAGSPNTIQNPRESSDPIILENCMPKPRRSPSEVSLGK